MTTKSTEDIEGQVKEPSAAEASGERLTEHGRADQARHWLLDAVAKLIGRAQSSGQSKE
jgi:hypothetical protein